MELRHVAYFIAVAEESSFSRAASRLCLSQPTLSQQVRVLEREVGGALLDRTPGRLRLTPAGEELLVRGRALLQAADQALVATRERVRESSDISLHVGYAPAVADHLIGDTVSAFRTICPRTRLVPHALVGGFEAALLDGTIDVGFLLLPLNPDRLIFEVIDSRERVLFVPKWHHLADAGRIPIDDILGLTYIPIDRRYAGREFSEFWQLDQQRGGPPRQSTGDPARTVPEVGQRIIFGEGVAIGIRGLDASHAAAVLNVDGLDPVAVAVARRRDDHRPGTRGFFELATQLASSRKSS